MKDAHRFGGDLRPGCDFEDIAGEQVLEMVDCRGPEMRALYRKAADDFLTGYLGTFIKDHHIPHAHLATVLLQMHEDRQKAYESGVDLQDPLPLTQVEKAKIPVLVLDAFVQASFLQDERKTELPADKRTFLVAFPGFNMSKVPAARTKDMEDCAKRKKAYPDACLTPPQQKLQLKTVELHLAGVMKGLREKFEETFNKLWPLFHYRKRTNGNSPAKLLKEFKAFRFGQSPPATKPPSSKTSSQSALSSSRFNVSSQIKQIADPAKMTGSLRVPNAEGDLDPPQPQPEVVVIEDPGIAPEKKKVDPESDKDEEVIDAAQLEDFLSQPKPVEKSQVEEPKPQSQQEQQESQSQKDPSKSQNDSPKYQNWQQQPNSQQSNHEQELTMFEDGYHHFPHQPQIPETKQVPNPS